MGWLSLLFWTKSSLCWPKQRYLWLTHCRCCTVDDIPRSLRDSVLLSIIRCKSKASGCWMTNVLNFSLQGQYHFVFILAPKKYKKFAAFSVGWMNILGWSVALCSGVSVVVASVSGLIAFWNPAFHVTQLQSYLLYVGVTVLSGLFDPSCRPNPAN